MSYRFDEAAQMRLEGYVRGIGEILRNKKRRESFAMYFCGLLGDGERKSVEPMAARAAESPEQTRALTERLLHFVADSEWDDAGVRRYAARHGIEAITAREPIQAWIVDDTGFLKQGRESPGVQRQYTGSAGKTTNCQVATSLTVCSHTQELAIDMDLYIPESWAQDAQRCRRARIPEALRFRPKWRIALDLIERAVAAGVPQALVLADAGYGTTSDFRDGVRALGLDYAVDVQSTVNVCIVGSDGSHSDPMSVGMVSDVIGGRSFRNVTWREGTRHTLAARFAAVRVRPAPNGDSVGEEQWLVIERSDDDKPAAHYVLCTLPKTLSRKELIRRIKQRWRIERTYEDMKGELGLDHFEGRTYPGWQHHVSCVLACAAFVAAERSRHFPPSARGPQAGGAVGRAA